ncbi:MAG: addiction module toxin RelE [Candidatus Methanogaster sp.]|uniref:Addiction module toxin RelE n=1 Tax=Candidatus Methanogaster sp. TaxID=3386292 RepID=A0AC61L311_9EURY|nr:MAG: addiction module toxin RelE [ANME-2 cluster archaeon]
MYDIVVHRNVAKNVKNIPKLHLRKLSLLLEVLKTNQLPYIEFDLKKIRGTDATYRVWIGAYRVVYFVEEKAKTVHILKFEHREKVY